MIRIHIEIILEYFQARTFGLRIEQGWVSVFIEKNALPISHTHLHAYTLPHKHTLATRTLTPTHTIITHTLTHTRTLTAHKGF